MQGGISQLSLEDQMTLMATGTSTQRAELIPAKSDGVYFKQKKGNQEKPSEITKLLPTWTIQQFITSMRSLWMGGSHRTRLGLQKVSLSLVPRNLLKLSPFLLKLQVWASEPVTVTVQKHPGWQEPWVCGLSLKMHPAPCWTCFPCVPQGSKRQLYHYPKDMHNLRCVSSPMDFSGTANVFTHLSNSLISAQKPYYISVKRQLEVHFSNAKGLCIYQEQHLAFPASVPQDQSTCTKEENHPKRAFLVPRGGKQKIVDKKVVYIHG